MGLENSGVIYDKKNVGILETSGKTIAIFGGNVCEG
jgi:hypothetical protein